MNKNSIEKIRKEENNYQHFEVIKRNRNKRHRFQEFFVEGVRNINEAIKNGWEIKNFLYSGEKELSNWAKDILENVRVERVFDLSSELMDKLSGKEDTSELIAIMSMKDDEVGRIKFQAAPLVAVFDRPSNKGNLGTIIRSCDALGCDGLIITGHAVDLYDPDTIISSMGSFFNLPSIRMPSHVEVFAWVSVLKNDYPEIQVVATSAFGEMCINDCDLTKPTFLLIGNETDGLTWNYKELSDVVAKIPIGGSASSLNVACAASILLYEVSRQRNK